jgi:hypothetical protein
MRNMYVLKWLPEFGEATTMVVGWCGGEEDGGKEDGGESAGELHDQVGIDYTTISESQ